MSKPLPLGTHIEPYGKIEAIANLAGERYYFMLDDKFNVGMMPAMLIERAALKENGDGG